MRDGKYLTQLRFNQTASFISLLFLLAFFPLRNWQRSPIIFPQSPGQCGLCAIVPPIAVYIVKNGLVPVAQEGSLLLYS